MIQNQSIDNRVKQRFLIRKSDKLISVSVDNINCFYAKNRVNFLMTAENKSYVIDETMEQLERNLHPEDFFRINRSCIVAYQGIQEVSLHSSNRLKIKLNNSETEIFVAKERVREFKKWIGGN
ncbi:MAG TPA: LytTR family DNA-binding domain-containing protein [Flavisolibacter sp.]|nr:LytTR family DNA-binding domain-containing protein [Flavisolibacter sp.]